MNVLITGVTGFVGSHLTEYLLSLDKDMKIFGGKRWRSPMENLSNVQDKISFVDMELNDPLSVKNSIKESNPDIIFHLGAQSFIPAGVMQPISTFGVNSMGTLNVLEAVRSLEIDPIVHVCSTADVYGNFDKDGVEVDETTAPRPPNLYAVSKLAAEMLGVQYFQSYGIKSVCSRILNHTGPRRGPTFAESSFSIQIAEIEKGIKEKVIEVGNLEAVRTFMDVRDAVKSYWLLVNKCKPGETYNITGDATMTIKKLLDDLVSLSTLKDEIEVKVDPKRFRPADSFRPIVKKDKFVSATGWKPEIGFEQTLKDLLDYWRGNVNKG